MSRYIIEIFNTTASYAECPECAVKPCPAIAPNRTCRGGQQSNSKVGVESCMLPSGGEGLGKWYSLPSGGECSTPACAVGVDGFWKVRSHLPAGSLTD